MVRCDTKEADGLMERSWKETEGLVKPSSSQGDCANAPGCNLEKAS